MEVAYEQAISGEPAYKWQKYKDAAERLHKAVLAFSVDDHTDNEDDDEDHRILKYLRGIAHNLSY
jgi:hypothetical protein